MSLNQANIYFWYDNTGHKPYCLTNLKPYDLNKIDRLVHHEGFDSLEVIKKYDPLLNQTVEITKIIAKDPLAIGGRPAGTIRDIVPEDFPRVSETHIEPQEIKIWEVKNQVLPIIHLRPPTFARHDLRG